MDVLKKRPGSINLRAYLKSRLSRLISGLLCCLLHPHDFRPGEQVAAKAVQVTLKTRTVEIEI
jgi:hypothetical protein